MPRLPQMLDLDLRLPRPPFWLVALVITMVVLSWVPLVLIARSRVTLSENRPVHLFLDMDVQPRYEAQAPSPLFADGRAMRPPVAGTVAWGEHASEPDPDMLQADDHYYRGYTVQRDALSGQLVADYFEGMPRQITVDQRLLQRGRTQYTVYCFPCHGHDGRGEGPVNQRALQLQAAGAGSAGTVWTRAANLLQTTPEGELQFGPELYEDGRLFNTISNGRNNMAGYRDQISVHDRWAIVAYVRALQLSQRAPVELLTDEQRDRLRQ